MLKVLYLHLAVAMLLYQIRPFISGILKLKLGVNVLKKCQIEPIRPSPFQCVSAKIMNLNLKNILNSVSIQFPDSVAKIQVLMKMMMMNIQWVITKVPPKLIWGNNFGRIHSLRIVCYLSLWGNDLVV